MQNKNYRNFWVVFFLMASMLVAAWLTSPTMLVQSQTESAEVQQSSAKDVSYQEVVASPQSPKYLGAMSCSSTACHGSVLPNRGGVNNNDVLIHNPLNVSVLQNEYIVWLEEDPHSRAVATLCNERSQKILKALGALADEGDKAFTTDKYDSTMRLCSTCHNPARSFNNNNSLGVLQSEMRQMEGVTCESCHGAAADYLTPHYMSDWPKEDAAMKASKYGMTNTEHLLSRARMCAKCHVGAEGMEVNHDLIAAGHPSLKFEFTSYLELLPKHWDEQQERNQVPDFETRAWVAGQVANVEASLDLLVTSTSDRDAAKHPYGQPVYPEFAQYDCFACHHDLQEPSWRQSESIGDQAIGRLSWGSWYYTMTNEIIGKEDNKMVSVLQDLRDAMGNLSTPRDKLHSQAMAARRQLAEWVFDEGLEGSLSDYSVDGSWPMVKSRLIDNLSATLTTNEGRDTVRNWDVAVQNYLLLAALDQAMRDRKGAPNAPRTATAQIRLRELRSVRQALAFPVHYDSPLTFSSVIKVDEGKMLPSRDHIRSQFIRIGATLHD